MFGRKNIFVSHSSHNKDIARQVCAYITRFGANDKQIFCSSMVGQGVGNGEKLNDAICKAIRKSKLLIYLLSYDFLNSSYCMQELGVGWYLAQRGKATCFYLVLPDVDLSELKGFVNPKIDKFSFVDIDRKDDLGLFAVDVAKKLKHKTPEHQIIVNASETFFSATGTLLINIKESYENLKKEEERKINEIATLKSEVKRRDDKIQRLSDNKHIDYEDIQQIVKTTEFETICRHFRHLGYFYGITKEEFELFSKDFWFSMVNKYIELEDLSTSHNPSMDMLLATIYSANGNHKEAYERLKKYASHYENGIYPDFYSNVIIEETNDMQEIIDILKERLATEPQGIVYDSYVETIEHLEDRKKKNSKE